LAKLSTERGLTYLFITHDLTVVKAISDRVLVMRDGRIIERGDTKTVFHSPHHDYTKKLIASAPQIQPVEGINI
jgi:peptide/nickel transport system ATP-binding protein